MQWPHGRVVRGRTSFVGGSRGAGSNPSVATSNLLLLLFSFIVFLPFGFLLFILTADPVSFARFLQNVFLVNLSTSVWRMEISVDLSHNFTITSAISFCLLVMPRPLHHSKIAPPRLTQRPLFLRPSYIPQLWLFSSRHAQPHSMSLIWLDLRRGEDVRPCRLAVHVLEKLKIWLFHVEVMYTCAPRDIYVCRFSSPERTHVAGTRLSSPNACHVGYIASPLYI